MRFTCDLPDHAVACEIVLDALIEVARVMIRAGVVPPFPHDVKNRDGGYALHYQLEPAGEEDWKLPDGVMRDGWFDCEDGAIWVAAGIRETGRDAWGVPVDDAWVRIVRTGRNKLHAVVEGSDGVWRDPSVELMRPDDLRRYTDARSG